VGDDRVEHDLKPVGVDQVPAGLNHFVGAFHLFQV
jgi:hypothetical protein